MTGWKSWAIGEVVEATDFQSYVQDQVVQIYADSTARTTALGTAVTEGMVSYLQDTNLIEVYDGASWINFTGDITGVTAGTALTGGGTSGNVTLDVNMSAISIPAAQINNLGTGVATFLTTPTSANLRAAVTDETGSSGALVFANSPTFTGNINVTGAGANMTIGRLDGVSSTPFIDFNSGATVVDYDSRIIATGGNGTTGNGTLQVVAGTLNLPATTNIGSVSSTELGYLDGVTSALQTQLDAKAPLTPSVNAKTGAYTLAIGDRGEFITANGTFTITIPSATFSAGDRIDFVNIGTGVITFAGSGVTVSSKDAKVTIASQYAAATFLFTSASAGVLIGDLA